MCFRRKGCLCAEKITLNVSHRKSQISINNHHLPLFLIRLYHISPRLHVIESERDGIFGSDDAAHADAVLVEDQHSTSFYDAFDGERVARNHGVGVDD